MNKKEVIDYEKVDAEVARNYGNIKVKKKNTILSICYEIYTETEKDPLCFEEFKEKGVCKTLYDRYCRLFTGLYCFINGVDLEYKDIPKNDMDDMLRCYMKALMTYPDIVFTKKLEKKEFDKITSKEIIEFASYMRQALLDDIPEPSDLYFDSWKEELIEKIRIYVKKYIDEDALTEIEHKIRRMSFMRHNKHKWEKTVVTLFKNELTNKGKNTISEISRIISDNNYNCYFKEKWQYEIDMYFDITYLNTIQLNYEEELINAIQEKITHTIKCFFVSQNDGILAPKILNNNPNKKLSKNNLAITHRLFIPAQDDDYVYLSRELKELLIKDIETEIKLIQNKKIEF